ncbi:PaaX family transcriptional regulator [Saccharothrix syringae]|uniref:PaaX family transcriptional regulator n=1 Tax=Saccharothrix syringae TaxID=103733 RepID=A0A5Q0H4Y4_SACSY|nr:PaaX family transcriptional regulator C-terminal domain-containing protein [Saccharothrix syringae]QFZ20792.1 PaaX family transcriptional regulator [Saccharothrix syringae]
MSKPPAGGSPQAARLPRMQAGPNPQHLLVTLMGDYWGDGEARAPSQALVAILAEFGITERSARTALARLVRRDVLSVEKEGRRTFYTLTKQAITNGWHSRDQLLRLGHRPSAPAWDRKWLVVAYSVPTEVSVARTNFRTRLRAAGFAPLQDAVWISPTTKTAVLAALLGEFPEVNATVFTADALSPITADSQLESLWDLTPAARRYAEFVERFEPVLARVRDGRVDGREALLVRTETMDMWRESRRVDPDLPDQLAPADWARPRARELLVRLYDGLGPLAEQACRSIVAPYDGEDRESTQVRHYSIADYLDAGAPPGTR